jgi:polysaccharide biosynthesis protein PslH
VISYPDFSGKDVEQGSLLFVGNYDYIPNANAAKVLLRNNFPPIKKYYPSAKLYLIGKGLPLAL